MKDIKKENIDSIYDKSNYERLLNKIYNDSIRVVSFDIFDTLLVRPMAKPTELFNIVAGKVNEAPNYIEKRIKAERCARIWFRGKKEDICLEDIFDTYGYLYGKGKKDLEILKNAEIETEWECLKPRESIKAIYSRALERKKKIIIVSDMYLPKKFIEQVLKKNEYEKYDRLYLSSEQGYSKYCGSLYKLATKDCRNEGIQGNEILHIGDNFNVDILKAHEYKWQTFYYPKAIEALQNCNIFQRVLRDLHIQIDKIPIGEIANVLFDNPFNKYEYNTLYNCLRPFTKGGEHDG